MEALRRVYNGVIGFVDEFANSTSHTDGSPRMRENASAWYAEWEDNYMGGFLNNALTKTCLRKIADNFYGKELDEALEKATPITPSSYPMLNAIYEYCGEKLGMFQRPQAYITDSMMGINALSVEVKNRKLILVSRNVAAQLTPDEQAFLLGHELGHHQQGNLVCHTVNGLLNDLNDASELFGPIIADTMEVPLKRWCRCSEFNADRAGYICCEDIDSIFSLFRKALPNVTHSASDEYRELSSSHPLLATRLKELNKYISQKEHDI